MSSLLLSFADMRGGQGAWLLLAVLVAGVTSLLMVSSSVGHSDPALTLRVYAHAMPEDETDLSFADFHAPKRPYTAPIDKEPSTEPRNYLERMARREGLAGERSSPSASPPEAAREPPTLVSTPAARFWFT
jgi:hypothetical protein